MIEPGFIRKRREGRNLGEPRLVVEGLHMASEDYHGVDLRNITLEVRAGEIFGIAGVAGNGQNELLLALSGERLSYRPETIRVDDIWVGRMSAGAMKVPPFPVTSRPSEVARAITSYRSPLSSVLVVRLTSRPSRQISWLLCS